MQGCHSRVARRLVSVGSQIDKPVANVTLETVDTALKNIVQVASFISTDFFSDAAFGSVVPVPQFDVLEHLDAPWVDAAHLPALHEHWHAVSDRLADWTDNLDEHFLPRRPST